MAVSIFIYIVAVAAGFCLLNLIPQPNGLFWRLLVGAGKLIAALFILVICGVLTVELTKGLWKKAESVNVPAKKKEILSFFEQLGIADKINVKLNIIWYEKQMAI